MQIENQNSLITKIYRKKIKKAEKIKIEKPRKGKEN
jgi:hypothetical protein